MDAVFADIKNCALIENSFNHLGGDRVYKENENKKAFTKVGKRWQVIDCRYRGSADIFASPLLVQHSAWNGSIAQDE